MSKPLIDASAKYPSSDNPLPLVFLRTLSAHVLE